MSRFDSFSGADPMIKSPVYDLPLLDARDDPVDNPEPPRHFLRPGGQQIPQRERQRQHPLYAGGTARIPAAIACPLQPYLQLVTKDAAAFISLMANMPEFQQQSWHDLTTAGMNGNDIEDVETGLIWIMERSAD